MAVLSLEDLRTVLKEFLRRSIEMALHRPGAGSEGERAGRHQERQSRSEGLLPRNVDVLAEGRGPQTNVGRAGWRLLQSDMVDEGGLAEKLREKYCPATDKSPNVGGKTCTDVSRVGS